MAAIETTGLTKRYGSIVALRELELTVTEGEIYGFLGPNGAGKSTTIDVLMDYTRPTDGTASVFGYDTRDDAVDVHRRVGILPDRFGLYDRLTGRRHVEYVVESKRADDDPSMCLERVGLGDAGDRRVGGYSRGMEQRLALAMALVGDPDLLILDEPFTGLDPNGARRIREVVYEENNRGATVFFSSHVLGQVELICDRIGILAEGELIAEGTVNDLRTNSGVGNQLLLTTDRSPEEIIDDVRTVDGVIQAVVRGGKIKVVCSDADVSQEVTAAIEVTGATVLECTTREPSIEDLFVAHTADDSAAYAATLGPGE